MAPPKLSLADRASATFVVRMTPTQKTKLELLGKGVDGGASALFKAWLDAQPLPGAAPKASPRPGRRARTPAPTSSIPEPAAAQLSLTPARFVELDP